MRRALATVAGMAWLAVCFAAALPGAEQKGIVRAMGLPIPGATVTATQGDTTKVTSTNESGVYALPGLAPGRWTLQVQMFGFETARRDIDLPDQATLDWDLTLKSAAAPAGGPPARPRAGFERLSLNRTAQREIQQQLESAALPAAEEAGLERNATESFLISGSLSRGLQLQPQPGGPELGDRFGPGPGMFGPEGAPPGFDQPGGGMGMGGPGGFGGPGGPGGFGGPGGPGGFGGPGGRGAGGRGGRPTPEMAERWRQMRVSGQAPEWMGGRGVAAFGNRRARSRDGIRGGAFFSLGNSALDARPYSITGQAIEKPSYAKARFGVTAGGQLKIPKLIDSENTFFFVNYFGSRSRNAYDATATVPGELERAGDFAQTAVAGGARIFDPLNGQPFPGNRIPASRISFAAAGLLRFIPAANLAGAVQNYQIVTSVPSNSDDFGLRVNHSLTGRDNLSGGFQLQNRHAESAQLYGFRDLSEGRGWNLNLGWTRTVQTALINNLRARFSRNTNDALPYFAYGADIAGELGIQGTSRDPVNFGPPNLQFTNFGALSDGSPSARRDQSASVGDELTWVKGQHTFRVGGEYRRNLTNVRTDQNGRGSFTFTGLATSAFDAAGNPLADAGFDFADFLLGLPQSSSIRYGASSQYFRSAAYSGFAQDNWRVRGNFSVSAGLRYEYAAPAVEKYNRMANLDIAPGFTAVAVVTPEGTGPYTGAFPRSLVDPDANNLAPRIGVAWRPWDNRSLRIRAGYGVYFNGSVYNQIAGRLAQQPPFADAVTLNSSLAHTLTIENGFTGGQAATVTNTYAVNRGYEAGYAQTWNVSLQHDLPWSLVMEAGYLGTKGTRLDVQRSPNRAAPGSPLTSEERRRIGNAVGFIFDSSEGNSIYHAGQFRLMRRFRRGVSFNVLYAWSKSIDNVSSYGGGQAVVVQNDRDLSAERGLSSFDIRHSLASFFTAGSPVGDGQAPVAMEGWARRLLEDWTLTGGVTANSGSPFTALVLGNQADAAGTGVVGSARADATGLPVGAGQGFFNTLAFTTPAAGAFGNAARNTIPGPRFLAANMSFGRSFPLGGDRRRMDIRVEAQNVFNTVSFTRLATTVNATDYGRATAAGPMRTIGLNLRFRF